MSRHLVISSPKSLDPFLHSPYPLEPRCPTILLCVIAPPSAQKRVGNLEHEGFFFPTLPCEQSDKNFLVGIILEPRKERGVSVMAESASSPSKNQEEKAPEAERAAVEAELVAFLYSPVGQAMETSNVIAWRRLLMGVRNGDFCSHDLAGIRDVMERTKFPERFAQQKDEWKLTHPQMLHNGVQMLAYYLINATAGDVLRLVNLSSGVSIEIVRESSHFSKEQVQGVFSSIVQSKTGQTTAQTAAQTTAK